jgi:hypothetical protein
MCTGLKVVAKVGALWDTAGEGERGVANIAAHGTVGTHVLEGLSTLVILCPSRTFWGNIHTWLGIYIPTTLIDIL